MNSSRCDYCQELVSAHLDGELVASEALEMKSHLDECEECRRFEEACRSLELRMVFTAIPKERVDETAICDLHVNGSAASNVGSIEVISQACAVKSADKSFRRFVLIAASAALMVLVGSVIWHLRNPRIEPVSIDSLLNCYATNIEMSKDQQSLLLVVEMDLRTMLLELKMLEVDDETRTQMQARIEGLLGETHRIAETQVAYYGEFQ